LQLSNGSEIELAVLSQIEQVDWLIGHVDVSYDPFMIHQVFQIENIEDRLKHRNFVQEHHAEFTHRHLESMQSFDPARTIARLNRYFAAIFNIGKTSSHERINLEPIPHQNHWDFLRNRPNASTVEIYASLTLLSVTTDSEDLAWRQITQRERLALIRVIEVWHQHLSRYDTKILFSKLERSTNQNQRQFGGILGAWWKLYGFAQKNNDHWEFDVPKMLAYYEIPPLSPAAIAEFQQRGREFKERHDL
jgi:hypothetical protein